MLNDLKRSLQAIQPTPLSDERFDQSHEWFEGQSNQQAQILAWLQRFGERQLERRGLQSEEGQDAFRVLSVGCGSGILDLPLVKTLAEHADAQQDAVAIHYAGIDPNPVACKRFRSDFESLGISSVDLSVHEETVESYEHNQKVDLTHVVHSMYYFADPADSLTTLIDQVADEGELVIFQAPKGELNRLADCFWQGHLDDPIWFSAELDQHLQQTGISFTRSRLDAEVDVTACFDRECQEGQLTFDFLVQSDCQDLSEPIRDQVLDHLRSISRVDAGKILAPHPVDVFVIHQSGESQTHSDARAACSP